MWYFETDMQCSVGVTNTKWFMCSWSKCESWPKKSLNPGCCIWLEVSGMGMNVILMCDLVYAWMCKMKEWWNEFSESNKCKANVKYASMYRNCNRAHQLSIIYDNMSGRGQAEIKNKGVGRNASQIFSWIVSNYNLAGERDIRTLKIIQMLSVPGTGSVIPKDENGLKILLFHYPVPNHHLGVLYKLCVWVYLQRFKQSLKVWDKEWNTEKPPNLDGHLTDCRGMCPSGLKSLVCHLQNKGLF